MRKAEYEAYIHSPKWSNRRTAYFAKFAKECRGCGTKRNIHLHHHTYDRVGGEELDSDLVPVCGDCHALIHQYHSIGGKTLSVCTFEVLAYLTGQVGTTMRPNKVVKRIAVAKNSIGGKADPVNLAMGKIRYQRRLRLKGEV